MKVLVTGGSGRLGKQLKKLMGYLPLYEPWFPTHEELDITKPIKRDDDVKLIIHCAAYTDVAKAEKEQDACFRINVLGTDNLSFRYMDVPFVYISSEYAKYPVNYYSMTKAIAEEDLQRRKRTLIIRTLFKPRPYPYPSAFTDQMTQGDYSDIIADLIMRDIVNWDKQTSKMIYVGTGRKTIYDLAKRTVWNIKKSSIKDIKTVVLPPDYL